MNPPQESQASCRRASEIIGPEHAGQRLDHYLLGALKGVPKSRLARAVRQGEVRVNARRVLLGYRLAPGDAIRLPPLAPGKKPEGSALPFVPKVLFEDEDFLAVDKPAGMPAHGGSSAAHGLIERLRAARPGAFLHLGHRLDQETSGVLLAVKSRQALVFIHEAFRKREMEKTYLALVLGAWPREIREIDLPLLVRWHPKRHKEAVVDEEKGLRARTLLEPLAFGPDMTLLEVHPLTGRTHQIRAHLAQAGHPVAGDRKYGGKAGPLKGKSLFLHAWRLAFTHPFSGRRLSLEAPLPLAYGQALAAQEITF